MGISIRPDSWFLSWIKDKKERELRIADYLDNIAVESTNLAQIWEEVVRTIQTRGTANANELELWNLLLSYPKEAVKRNGMPVSRLQEFYRGASIVLGDKYKDELEYVVFKIGNILKNRNLTKEFVEKEIKKINNAKYFSDSEIELEKISLDESIEILHKEAGALYVAAKEFRAKIK